MFISAFIATIHCQRWASSERRTSNNPNNNFIDFRLKAIQNQVSVALFSLCKLQFSAVYWSIWKEVFFCGACHLCAVSIYAGGVLWNGAGASFPVIHKCLIRLQLQIRCVRMSSSVMFPKAGACGRRRCCDPNRVHCFGGLMLINANFCNCSMDAQAVDL